jgi:hypothetical protein
MIASITFGALLMAVGAWFMVKGTPLQRRGARTAGRVVALQRERDPVPDAATGVSNSNYYPVLEFRTAGGEQVQAVARSGGNPAPARVGDDVRVLYDPANPSVADIEAFRGGWLSLLAVLAGAGFIAVPIIHTIRHTR